MVSGISNVEYARNNFCEIRSTLSNTTRVIRNLFFYKSKKFIGIENDEQKSLDFFVSLFFSKDQKWNWKENNYQGNIVIFIISQIEDRKVNLNYTWLAIGQELKPLKSLS